MLFKSYKWVSLISLILIYLVILAGSIVRMTGSGMGCPDWPKCFNQWVPPTHIEQLPENYREIFLDKRKAKIEKYASFLTSLGMGQVAEALTSDPDLLEEEPFVARKTWIEYVNRLFGFMAGNFLLLGFILSLFLWKKNRGLALWSFLAVLFTGIQGWFGSIVVSSNLTPWTISFHMLFALLIIAVIIYCLKIASERSVIANRSMFWLVGILIVLSLVQIYFGTQVRQEIDVVAKTTINRSVWIEGLSSVFEIHRSFAIAIILIHGWVAYKLRQEKGWSTFALILLAVIVIEAFTGIIMAYLAVPKAAQPIHLFLATIAFGMQVWLLLHLKVVKV